MSPILCISDFELQYKHLEKFNSNRATKNRRCKSKFFCMYGTVALRSPIQIFKTGELQFCSKLRYRCVTFWNILFSCKKKRTKDNLTCHGGFRSIYGWISAFRGSSGTLSLYKRTNVTVIRQGVSSSKTSY